MGTMPVAIDWRDAALRLALTALSGMLIGFNRREHGKAAGLRTTTLVGLAACVAMIQTNLLLPMLGKTPQSFAVMDLMRLPLGILTGVGFIGAGVIIKRGEGVAGVTTAATLWVVTTIGLCFGGGQIGLGCAVTAVVLGSLSGLGWAELRIKVERRSRLLVEVEETGPGEDEIAAEILRAGPQVTGIRVSADGERRRRELEFELLELRHPTDFGTPAFVSAFSDRRGVVKLRWESLA